MSKIDDELPTEVLNALAVACGFHLSSTPGVDEWTLSHPHGVIHTEPVHHVGTRKAICAFLTGYADMQLQTTQILNDFDSAQRKLILEMRGRSFGR